MHPRCDVPARRRCVPIRSRASCSTKTTTGWWVKPGAGYGPKYTGTVWSLMFLEQMGADGRDRRIQRACDHVLAHTQAPNGGFGWQAQNSTVVHCLNGNLLRALLAFGRFDDPGVRASIAWEASAITGEGVDRWYRWTTSGPGFGCGINGTLPCGWGAHQGACAGWSRSRRGGAPRSFDGRSPRVPTSCSSTAWRRARSRPPRRSARIGRTSASRPGTWQTPCRGLRSSWRWAAGAIRGSPRPSSWCSASRTSRVRWRNEHAYRGKLWSNTCPPRAPSKWVTLRACRALKGAVGAAR